ncbi:phage tail length tape measure family protein [Polymorphobacter sp.]|uniref:phage tail length tape measure family protein n=1 Tax=Polymorphobacter sp. TaxID=1909290 RepID=UPI003F70C5FA
MTATLTVQAEVKADGSQAAAEIEKLGGKLSQTKTRLSDLKTQSRDAAQQLKVLETSGRAASTSADALKTSLASLAAREVQLRQEASAAAAALRELGNAQNRVGASAGQVRASTAQLGQQIGDVAQGMAMGTAASTIFAQQIGQVTFAMSGLNGIAGRIGTFLSGPWGAVLTGAAIVAASLANALSNSKEAAEDAAAGADKNKTSAERLTEAMKSLDQATGFANRSAREASENAAALSRSLIDEAKVTRAAAVEQLNLARSRLLAKQADKGLAIGSAANFGANFGIINEDDTIARQLKVIDAQEKKIAADTAAVDASEAFGRAERAAAAATDARAAAQQRYDEEVRKTREQLKLNQITEAQATAQLTRSKQALDASRDAARDAGREKRELAKEIRDAARAYEELVEAADKGRFAIAGTKFGGITSGGTSGQSIGSGAAELAARLEREALEKAAAKSREDSGLTRVIEAQERLIEIGKETGERMADGFRRRALTDAVAIGQAIGGSAGNLLTSIAAAAQGAATGDFTGLGGRAGGILTLLGGLGANGSGLKGLDRARASSPDEIRRADAAGRQLAPDAFRDGFREVFSKPIEGITQTLTSIFKDDGVFAKTIGRAAGGAATGSLVGEIGSAISDNFSKTGAQIGGALGGALSGVLGPLGGLLGSVAGGLFGGLFAKSGSTTVSSSGDGNIGQSGSGSAAVQRATAGLGNTIADTVQSIADALGADVGAFSVSIGKRGSSFRVDTSGSGRIRGSTVTATKDESEALQLAVADALRDGAIVASPRVQTALRRYADNVNKAVAEALKVKGLEELLANRDNPFAGVFNSLEDQIAQRLKVANDYGFDLVQIEEINGEERARVLRETLQSATGSIRSLLDDLNFGSRATGSISERLTGLTAERDRVTALARGGDTSQLDVLAQIISQIDDLQREAFGATAPAADGRTESIALLNDLVAQTEGRIQAAADAARVENDRTYQKLTEANASLDDMVNLMGMNNAYLSQLIAQGGYGGAFLGGYAGFDLASIYAR